VQVDHPGVPNSQLAKEKSPLAVRYKEKSIVEQNSVDMAWDLLMKPEFLEFRQVLCENPADMQRFRQIVVNMVIATDIMDPDLKMLRNMRWSKAFDESTRTSIETASAKVNRKATIVLEHLLQASDVSICDHVMHRLRLALLTIVSCTGRPYDATLAYLSQVE
jgi:3'5'-cyclic nucleotide phosphodiesterase